MTKQGNHKPQAAAGKPAHKDNKDQRSTQPGVADNGAGKKRVEETKSPVKVKK